VPNSAINSTLTYQQFSYACLTPSILLCVCSASYRNKENIDLSKVAAFAQHGSDVGGTAVQIARLSARVEQLTLHMQNNRKDFGSKRGLQAVLAQRRSLMQYLYRTDRWEPRLQCLRSMVKGFAAGWVCLAGLQLLLCRAMLW
jgi:ribosomal protein S15